MPRSSRNKEHRPSRSIAAHARSVSLRAIVGTLMLAGAVHCAGSPRVVEDEPPPSPRFEVEEADAAPPETCQGLACDVATCPEGEETRVSGKVYAPNGTLPLAGATVYVPSGAIPELHAGATCETCAAWLPERPVAVATTAADGSFELRGVPVGTDVPLVVQVGKWRRTVTLPRVDACTAYVLPREATRLPRSRAEGDMPRIALTTGVCDDIGCLLPKLGIDPSEIGVPSDGDTKRVHVYRGAMDAADAPRGASPSSTLWSSAASLSRYDMLLLSCECGERTENKGPQANEAMTRYLESGGRIFTTDFMYTFYRDSPSAELRRAIDVRGGGHEGGRPMSIVPGSAGGKELSSWLVAATPESLETREGRVDFESVFENIASVDPSRARVWAVSPRPLAPASPPGPRIVSIDFPIGKPEKEQCGRAVHIDAHVHQPKDGDRVGPDYPRTCGQTMSTSEAALAFFLFHLADCVVPPPARPGVPPTR